MDFTLAELGLQGAVLEAGAAGLIVDARAWRAIRLASDRGVEEAFRL